MSDRRKTPGTIALERRKRNRRAFPRWELDFEVRLSWQGRSISCRGCEIGEGGLSVLCAQELPIEVEIDVEYRLSPQSSPVQVKGSVRYIEGGKTGIGFLNLGLKERLALVAHCEKLKTL